MEFHVHGGRAVVSAVETALAAQSGLRRAKPGEFTRRALRNGIIDLTEAEGLRDLLLAETEAQRHAAFQIADGGLRARIADWTMRLVGIAAQVEAGIDFSEEDDVSIIASDELRDALRKVLVEVDTILREPSVERLRDGIRVVLAGPPNSGKSTLLNVMADRNVAIVSPIAGTTRDRIEASVIRDGVAYVLTDTAGLNQTTDDPIERIGVERACEAIAAADIVLWLGDEKPERSDAIPLHARADSTGRETVPSGRLAVSATMRTGITELWKTIQERVASFVPHRMAMPTNARQRTTLSSCGTYIANALAESDPLVVAEYLRLTLLEFDVLTGRSGIEDVLDAIFSNFCIGK